MSMAETGTTSVDTVGQAQPGRQPRRGWRDILSLEHIVMALAALVLMILVAYPITWLLLGSLGLPRDFSTRFITNVIVDTQYMEPLLNTLVLGFAVMVAVVVMGVPMAWGVARTDMPGQKFFRSAPLVAFLTAPYLSALAYIMLLGPNAGLLNKAIRAVFGLQQAPFNIFGPVGVIFVISAHLFAYAFFMTTSALESMDASLEESAQILGANKFQTMMRVTLPLVMPAISSAALLSFVASIALFGPQAFLGLPERVYYLPTKIWTLLSTGYPPRYSEASALGLGIVALTAFALFVQRSFLEKRSYVVLSGKGTRPSRVKLGPWKWALCGYSFFIILISVILPYGVFVVAAFSKDWLDGPSLSNFTLRNFPFVLFDDQRSSRAILNSFMLAAGAATLAVLLGLLISFIDLRTKIRGRRLLDYLSILPLGVPGIVLAVGLIQAWLRSPIPVYGTIWVLLIAYMTRYIPISVRSSNTAIRQVDASLEEAARVAGASWGDTMRRITVPLVKPGLLVAWTLVFVPSLQELNTSILLYTQGTEVISVMIFKLNELGYFEAIAALSMITVALAMTVLLITRKLAGKSLEELAGT
ncbi:MAG: iron ABC transporter permease [Chloroflexi bacterium]|nr:iron ABC transporter permease [Chloroflexota bacterium]MCL5107283.1 iron ABC transporter permease [Chloroflexota bacterium]